MPLKQGPAILVYPIMSINIKMGKDLIVTITLPNGHEFCMELHDNGLSIIVSQNEEKDLVVQKFSPTAIVLKQK